MNRFTKIIIGFVIVIVVVIGGMLALAEFFWEGSVHTSLDAKYLPTAEYLVEQPMATPSHIDVSLGIRDDNRPCISVFGDESVSSEKISEWTQIILNNHKVGITDLEVSTFTTYPGYNVYCVEADLEVGLHMIEIKIKDSPFNTIYSHQWAFSITD